MTIWIDQDGNEYEPVAGSPLLWKNDKLTWVQYVKYDDGRWIWYNELGLVEKSEETDENADTFDVAGIAFTGMFNKVLK